MTTRGVHRRHAHPALSTAANGKAARLIKTLLAEWAYARPYHSNDERLATLPSWLDFYNHDRPHTALGGLALHTALVNNLSGNHT